MRKEKDMTMEKRKHLAAWFSIIFIFVTLGYLCGYRNFVIHTCRNTGWLVYRGCRYGSILYQLCSRTDDGEKMI